MRCDFFRARLATTGVAPSGWLSTETVAPGGWLLMPTCWDVPCMIVAHAATSAGANTASETTFALRDMVPPLRGRLTWTANGEVAMSLGGHSPCEQPVRALDLLRLPYNHQHIAGRESEVGPRCRQIALPSPHRENQRSGFRTQRRVGDRLAHHGCRLTQYDALDVHLRHRAERPGQREPRAGAPPRAQRLVV